MADTGYRCGSWRHLNLITKAVQGKINRFENALAAFGIGALAGAAASWTGAASLAAVGSSLGAGGFLGGFASGVASSFVSTTMLSVGNATYFGDPMPTTGQFLGSLAIGGVMSGGANGLTALANNRTFWTGTPQTTTFTYPEIQQIIKTPNQLGKEGEKAANIQAPKERIESLTGTAKYRIPDGIEHEAHILYEVKNVSYQGYTYQIKDYVLYCQTYGYKFILVVRETSTTLSTPLQEVLKVIPSEVKYILPDL
jgi:hypothetical protein